MAPFIEVALIGWIPLTLGLFLVLRPHVAAAASLTFGVAFLPALREIDVPVMPDLTQYTIPVLASFMMVVFRTPQRLIAARPGTCLLYTSPSPRDKRQSRMPSSA